jgi:hypothetical protein
VAKNRGASVFSRHHVLEKLELHFLWDKGTTWEILKERNARTFDRRESPVPSLITKMKGEVSLWIMAGAKCLAQLVAHM